MAIDAKTGGPTVEEGENLASVIKELNETHKVNVREVVRKLRGAGALPDPSVGDRAKGEPPYVAEVLKSLGWWLNELRQGREPTVDAYLKVYEETTREGEESTDGYTPES